MEEELDALLKNASDKLVIHANVSLSKLIHVKDILVPI